jgi:hypothetical protein
MIAAGAMTRGRLAWAEGWSGEASVVQRRVTARMLGRCCFSVLAALALVGPADGRSPFDGTRDDVEPLPARQVIAAPSLPFVGVEAERPAALAVDDLLTRAQLEQDLDQFQDELEQRFAYLRANDADYLGAIAAIRQGAAYETPVGAFGVELRKVLGLFIDGHASVRFYLPRGYLPFRLEAIGSRFVAFWPDRSDFVSRRHPFITTIDGLSMEQWRSALDVIVQEGSLPFVNYMTLRYLEFITLARSLAGLADSQAIEVELESEDRSERITMMLEVSDQHPTVVEWPASQSGFLNGNIGYLRITGWDEEAAAEIQTWMPLFAGTDGLIVDIRHGLGGDRTVFHGLYPFFVTRNDPPRVANAAKYRLYSGFPYDHLAPRHMYRESWPGWTAAERAAIASFMTTFQPQWVVPEAEFSEWHFWVLSKALKPDAYDYQGRIVFLMDHKCGSGDDLVLSAVRGLDNVTLIGEASMGASGALVVTRLANSGLDLVLSSMASFQSTGLLYDGNGVEPEIPVEPVPEYYLVAGEDRVLSYALRFLTEPHRVRPRLRRVSE